jgi:hypothetical protein
MHRRRLCILYTTNLNYNLSPTLWNGLYGMDYGMVYVHIIVLLLLRKYVKKR